MFTGIIEKCGFIREISVEGVGSKLVVETGFVDLELGESVALNGVCLTVAELDSAGRALFHLSGETLARTAFGQVRPGERVNLERAMPAIGRFSGHIVQGHVDGIGQVEGIEPRDDGSFRFRVAVPSEILRYCIEKGSLCVQGISLTINAVNETGVEFMIIPHTWSQTTLSSLRPGDFLNLEADVIAKYVEKFTGRVK